MDTSKIIIELTDIISKELNYKYIGKLSYEEYSKFVYNFFKTLDYYKKKGVKKGDIEDFVNKLHTSQSTYFNDDMIEEDKFSFITEEIVNFCPSPFFWDVPLKEYMQKWEKFYFPHLKK